MTVDLPILGLGVALLVAGVAWRVQAIRRRRADFDHRARAALEDADPATRRAAVTVVSGQGLSAVAELLVERTRRESEGSVLDAIAEAVARNQWEPSYRREVFELRLWAQHRLEERTPVPRSRELTPGAALLAELLESGGHDPEALAPAPRGRTLTVTAADGWRRLRVTRTPRSERRGEAEPQR
jgi:hypothetical protein